MKYFHSSHIQMELISLIQIKLLISCNSPSPRQENEDKVLQARQIGLGRALVDGRLREAVLSSLEAVHDVRGDGPCVALRSDQEDVGVRAKPKDNLR